MPTAVSARTVGQPTTITHPQAIYAYTYDNDHRLQSVIDSRGNKQFSYAWSPGGWLNSVTDGEGQITTFRYDTSGRLAGLTAPDNQSLSFAFDAGGRLLQKIFASGVSSQYTWNADNSLSTVTHSNAGTTLATNVYTYDGVGNRNANTETLNGTAISYAYTYDELKRLTQVTNGTAAQQQNFTYDPLSNRIQLSVGQTSPAVTAYGFDAANELTSIHSGSLAGPLVATLSYDANGNLQSDGARTYTWDALDQLSQVTSGSATVAYGYDGLGQRINKNVNGTTTQWLYDRGAIYGQYGTSWSNPTARYSYTGVDQPLLQGQVNADGSDGTANFYLADGLGSVTAMANSNNGTLATQRFDAWGNPIASSGTIPQFGYTGREPDETGLVFYRARYYVPGIGRFASRDPSGMAGGLNLYAYVGNNPINRGDPFGLSPLNPQLIQLAQANTSYFGNTISDVLPEGAPIVTIGKAFGGLAAYVAGSLTGNQALTDAALEGLSQTQQQNTDALIFLGTMGKPGAKSGVPGDGFTPSGSVTSPYVRPIGTTTAQRTSVQGQPCVDCGAITSNQVADHIDPLVVQYYREGAVNVEQQSSVGAVQAHCPTCSAIQGGQLGAFAKSMLKFFGF